MPEFASCYRGTTLVDARRKNDECQPCSDSEGVGTAGCSVLRQPLRVHHRCREAQRLAQLLSSLRFARRGVSSWPLASGGGSIRAAVAAAQSLRSAAPSPVEMGRYAARRPVLLVLGTGPSPVARDREVHAGH